MLSLSVLLTLLATAAVATPLFNSDSQAIIVERGDEECWRERPEAPARFKRRNGSPNCGSYINERGDWDVRFNPGVESGTEDYKRRFDGSDKR